MPLRRLAARFLPKMFKSDRPTLSRDYFEKIYEKREDPWNFQTSTYEQEKYDKTLAALPSSNYENALEIGCSIGVQTERLANRCKNLVAIDTSDRALERARLRCLNLANITFARMTVPGEYPDGKFALTVLSEVGYYFNELDLALLVNAIVTHSAPKAHLLLVHWLLEAADHPVSGDRVHEIFLSSPNWSSLNSLRCEQYRIDVLQLAS